MRIERIQIEEGFLDGLDVTFAHGLNVIIGERGTGKTSLIELIRFCLGVPGYTSDSTKQSRDHALSVIGGGQATITLTEGDHQILVTRTATDDRPQSSGSFVRPTIFSQKEIESVGLKAQGRIRLLDNFSVDQGDSEARESSAASEVLSLTAEASAQRREIDELHGLVSELPAIEKQIADLAPQEQKVAKVSADADQKKTELDAISTEIAAVAVGADAIRRLHTSVSEWRASIASLLSAGPLLEPWPKGAGPDPLGEFRQKIEHAKGHLHSALLELQNAVSEADSHVRSWRDNKLRLEARARHLRKEVESLLQGAGAIVRRAQQLQERKAQLQSLQQLIGERNKALAAALSQRNAALDRLDSIRADRFRMRAEIATDLTRTLGPRIRVRVARAGQFDAFGAAITDALRGSGLRYNELSGTLAQSVSPRELVEAAETNDFELIADATGITKDRAARVLGQLRDGDLGVLATVNVEDSVALQLLDGTDYKVIADLSTGQRCTVVLPLVLQQTDRVLIVDQPEDHIDNAFIADTLITSLLTRRTRSQVILATHNANIPVLGNADRVIQLGSDGRRGFPILASSLDDPSVVTAITKIMEGGTEAFKARATFYGRHESA